MAQFSRIEVATTMKEVGMIPLFFNNNIELSKKVLKACYDGGAKLLEFTARGDFAHEVFGDLIKYTINQLAILKNFGVRLQMTYFGSKNQVKF